MCEFQFEKCRETTKKNRFLVFHSPVAESMLSKIESKVVAITIAVYFIILNFAPSRSLSLSHRSCRLYTTAKAAIYFCKHTLQMKKHGYDYEYVFIGVFEYIET